jgi:hypothetical protein
MLSLERRAFNRVFLLLDLLSLFLNRLPRDDILGLGYNPYMLPCPFLLFLFSSQSLSIIAISPYKIIKEIPNFYIVIMHILRSLRRQHIPF